MGEVDRAVAVSGLDAERLRRDFGARRVDVVENGVDPAYFRPQNVQREPARLLFLGSLDWRPNLDGVRVLLEQRISGGAGGRAVGAAVSGRPSSAGMVETGGDCARRRTARRLARRAAATRPLRHDGRAAADRRRLTAEDSGSAGHQHARRFHARRRGRLELEPEKHLTVVEDVDDLAKAIIQAVREPAAMQGQAERGREAVLARYGWDALADEMERVWIDCVSGQSPSV